MKLEKPMSLKMEDGTLMLSLQTLNIWKGKLAVIIVIPLLY